MQMGCAKESGFTLVEMLVALAIFSMISVAGVALLQSASSTQLAVKDRLGAIGDNSRAIAIIEHDLAQAIARPVRSTPQTISPAFVATGSETSGQLFGLTRTGTANLDNSPASELQRVVYALQNGNLKRIGQRMIDGGEASQAVLLNNITSATLQFRDAEGNWRQDWDASDPFAVPRALELVLVQGNAAPVRLLFLVGTSGPTKRASDQEGNEGEYADPA